MVVSRLIWTPLKLVPPGTNFSEIFGPTLKNLFPLQASHTKENQWLLRMLLEFTVAYLENEWLLFMSMPQRPMQHSKRAFVTNFAQCMRKLTVVCGREWDYSTLRAAELTGLSSLQKPWKPPRYATGPCFASEICSGSMFFHLWEVVQIFQRESIYCSKISSGGS